MIREQLAEQPRWSSACSSSRSIRWCASCSEHLDRPRGRPGGAAAQVHRERSPRARQRRPRSRSSSRSCTRRRRSEPTVGEQRNLRRQPGLRGAARASCSISKRSCARSAPARSLSRRTWRAVAPPAGVAEAAGDRVRPPRPGGAATARPPSSCIREARSRRPHRGRDGPAQVGQRAVVRAAGAAARRARTIARCRSLLAIISGLAVSLGGAFGLEYLNRTLRFERDVERYLGLPVLGTVAETRTK